MLEILKYYTILNLLCLAYSLSNFLLLLLPRNLFKSYLLGRPLGQAIEPITNVAAAASKQQTNACANASKKQCLLIISHLADVIVEGALFYYLARDRVFERELICITSCSNDYVNRF